MIHLVESPVLYVLAKKVENKRWGLLKRLHLLLSPPILPTHLPADSTVCDLPVT
jgi:hypothetical protein